MYTFTSVFSSRIEDMLSFRIARGYKKESHLHQLIRFDKYCCAQAYDVPELTAAIAHGWLDSEAESSRDVISKAMSIRQFGKYLCAIGEDAYILPDKYAPSRRAKPPYIFTDDELTALFAAIDKLPPKESEPYLTEIAPVLFRLTYTCGLRPNESRELLFKNVNLDSGEILITNTKRNKERIVVMSDDMGDLCRKYDLRRGIFSNGNPYFFPSYNGGCFEGSVVYATLNKAWKSICRTKKKQTIRVADLRHRFASACLMRWLDNGENLMSMLPYLQAYMGHDRMDETAYYIHILPENLIRSSAIDLSVFNSLFPDPPEFSELLPSGQVEVTEWDV